MVRVKNTKLFRSQPKRLQIPRPQPAQIDSNEDDNQATGFSEIPAHRKRGHTLQFSALLTSAAAHEACWQPTRDLFGSDGTSTADFHRYISKHGFFFTARALPSVPFHDRSDSVDLCI